MASVTNINFFLTSSTQPIAQQRGSWVWNLRPQRKRSAAPISRSRGSAESAAAGHVVQVASGRKFLWKILEIYRIMKHLEGIKDQIIESKPANFIKDPFGGIGFLLILVESLPSKNEDLHYESGSRSHIWWTEHLLFKHEKMLGHVFGYKIISQPLVWLKYMWYHVIP